MNDISLKISNPEKHIKSAANPSDRFSNSDKQRLAKASIDFESLLTGMMLKNMNKSSGLFGKEGFGNDVLDSVFESEMANYISKNNSLGIAKNLFRQITGEDISEYKMRVINGGMLSGKSSAELPISGKTSDKVDRFDEIINTAAEKFGVNKNLIKSIIITESAGNEKAVSKVKAKGLMQLMDSTAAEMGVGNVWDPADNIHGGTKYFSKMLEKFDGDTKLALAAYNAGPANVEKYNGVPPFKETQQYVARVLHYLNNMDD